MKRLVFILITAATILLHKGNAAAGEKLYAALPDEGGVAVVDISALEAWGWIKTGAGPLRIAASPDNKSVYLSVREDDKLEAIDKASDKVTATIGRGKGVYGLAVTPDSRYLVIGDIDEMTVSLYDIKNAKEIKRLKVSDKIYPILLSPRGDKVYAISNQRKMYVIGIDSFQVEKEVDIPARVYTAAVAPDGQKVFLYSIEDGTVTVMDTGSWREIKRLNAGGKDGVAVSPDGSELWYGGPGDKITVYSLEKDKIIATLPRDSQKWMSIVFSRSGKYVLAGPAGGEGTDDDGKYIFVYDSGKKEKIGEIRLPGITSGFASVE